MRREHIERLVETLEHLERDLQARRAGVSTRTRGVDAMIRTLAVVMGIAALANLYYVNDLTQEVKLMSGALREMTGHFGNVAERMAHMTGTIDSMDRSVALMPVVRDQMDELAGQIDQMRADVNRMRLTTAAIDGRMDLLNGGVFDMSQRFRGLNHSVAGMGSNVDQMARPIP